jgi:hypothetical protein
MKSLTRIMKANIIIPDFNSISKRRITLSGHLPAKAVEPGSLFIIDSNWLKVYGKDEWHHKKHNVSARRTWRKQHLAIDENHQVRIADVCDSTSVEDLLTQFDTPFGNFIDDGATMASPFSELF